MNFIINLFSIILCFISLLKTFSVLCTDFTDNCGERPIEGRVSRIVGGFDAFYGEVPWQVLLEIKIDNTNMQCGAILISNTWVLTAAHCLITTDDKNCRDIKVIFGKYTRFETSGPLTASKNSTKSLSHEKRVTNDYPIVTRNVSKVIINSNFNIKTYDNDIALIQLNQSISNEDNIQPICLPKPMQDFSEQTGHISGFGVQQYGSKRVPRLLQIVSVPILAPDYCQYMFAQLGYHNVVNYGKLCAGVIDGGRDACAGDSGGPLSVKRSEDNKWVLAGIISNGIKCGQPNTPGIYTQVSAYVDWIYTTIEREDKNSVIFKVV